MFDPVMAEMRFGYGLSPRIAAPESLNQMLTGLKGRDAMAERFPIERFETFGPRVAERVRLRRIVKGRDPGDPVAAQKELRAFRAQARRDSIVWMRQAMLRRVRTSSGFRERLVAFWADHFTAMGKAPVIDAATGSYVEEAIRPKVAGRFEDLLISASIHPLMLHFLDQDASIGPNSRRAQRKGGARGLNENLAREILELHTLGVDGPYSQDDVRQLAELLTGLGWAPKKGPVFRVNVVEPGAETVLGQSYGPEGGVEAIHAVLRDLARHPATAQHIAWKLAMHFVSDSPDPEMVDMMKAAYLDTGGDLNAVYKVLLSHPSAWAGDAGNVKRPIAFVSSTLRALDLPVRKAEAWKSGQVVRHIYRPLLLMGQRWERPAGPDGWAEEDEAWITPQGMAARMQWALGLPEMMGKRMPDPRDFVTAALGPNPPQRVVFAAEAAENRREGVALVLMSPAFQKV